MKLYDIIKEASKAFKGNKISLYLITLSAIILFLLLSGIILLAENHFYMIILALLLLFFYYITFSIPYGLSAAILKKSRCEKTRFFDYLIIAYVDINKFWGLFFRTLLKLIVPICSILVSFFVSILIYAVQQYYLSSNLAATIISIILATLIPIPSIIYTIIKLFDFTFNPLVLYDNPNLDYKTILNTSKEFSKGKKVNLFLLYGFSIFLYILPFIIILFILIFTGIPEVIINIIELLYIFYFLYIYNYSKILFTVYYDAMLNQNSFKIGDITLSKRAAITVEDLTKEFKQNNNYSAPKNNKSKSNSKAKNKKK